MVDIAPFTARLDAALAMNGLDNRTFASAFGPHGQQLVNGWRRRGRIGHPSLKRVRDLLPKTNVDWLQDGIGDPEPLQGTPEPSHNHDVRQSYAARLAPSILAKAVRVMEAEEHLHGKNSPLRHAILLLQYCDRIAAGESEADLIAEIYESAEGSNHGESETPGRPVG